MRNDFNDIVYQLKFEHPDTISEWLIQCLPNHFAAAIREPLPVLLSFGVPRYILVVI